MRNSGRINPKNLPDQLVVPPGWFEAHPEIAQYYTITPHKPYSEGLPHIESQPSEATIEHTKHIGKDGKCGKLIHGGKYCVREPGHDKQRKNADGKVVGPTCCSTIPF